MDVAVVVVGVRLRRTVAEVGVVGGKVARERGAARVAALDLGAPRPAARLGPHPHVPLEVDLALVVVVVELLAEGRHLDVVVAVLVHLDLDRLDAHVGERRHERQQAGVGHDGAPAQQRPAVVVRRAHREAVEAHLVDDEGHRLALLERDRHLGRDRSERRRLAVGDAQFEVAPRAPVEDGPLAPDRELRPQDALRRRHVRHRRGRPRSRWRQGPRSRRPGPGSRSGRSPSSILLRDCKDRIRRVPGAGL